MGRVFQAIDETMREWIGRQAMYFVGTAPNASDGHINISPKGSMQTFAIIDDRTIAYVDLVGSGIETTAHLRENGRIVVMFCAMSGPPKIVRFHGRGSVHPEHSPGFVDLFPHFTIDAATLPLVRSIIKIDVERIGDSCGFVVPELEFAGERRQLQRWGKSKASEHGPDWKHTYIAANNQRSLDRLPGLTADELTGEPDLTGLSSSGRTL